MSNNRNVNSQAVALGIINFIYLFASLFFTNPSLYQLETGEFSNGFGAAAVVYALGIFYPLLSKLMTGDSPEDIILRVTDIASGVFIILEIVAVVFYYFHSSESWIAWLAFIMAVLSALPSLFSFILASREYILRG